MLSLLFTQDIHENNKKKGCAAKAAKLLCADVRKTNLEENLLSKKVCKKFSAKAVSMGQEVMFSFSQNEI